MTPTPTQIITAVAAHTGIEVVTILGPRRTGPIAKARCIAAHIMRRLRNMSQPEIAEAMNLRSHSAVCDMLSRPLPWGDVQAVEATLANVYVAQKPPAFSTSRDVIRLMNSDAEVRRDVIAHLTPVIVGQIVTHLRKAIG